MEERRERRGVRKSEGSRGNGGREKRGRGV